MEPTTEPTSWENFLKQYKKTPRQTRKIIWSVILVALLLMGLSIFLAWKLKESQTPVVSAEAKVRQLVDEVSKAMLLPADELPTVAVVADPSVLKDQPFFAHAQTGDDILIYPTSKRAILWRPSIKRVIEVSSLLTSPIPTSTSDIKKIK